MRLWLRCFCLAGWCVAFAVSAQGLPVPARTTTVFTHVNVLPMDRERVLRDQTVLVRDGVIAAVGRTLKVPSDARVVDGGGKAWLLPGLADMHNHLDTRQDMAVLLGLGITTTMNYGEARNSFVGRTRLSVANGELAGPRAFVALAVDGSPRYGHLVVRDAEDARAVVRVAQANGYDALKLYNELSPSAFDALMKAAGEARLAVVGHGVTRVGLRRQIEAGQDAVAHAEEFFYTFFAPPPQSDPNAAPDPAQIPEAIALLKAHGTAVVADLVTYETIAGQWGRPDVVQGYLRLPQVRYLPLQYRASWLTQGYARRSGSLQARVAFLQRFVREMQAARVPLLSGTDAPDIPGLVGGYALHGNLRALEAAGLSRYDALATATSAPGEFVRKHLQGQQRAGVVLPGARADLLLVNGNPLEDLSVLMQPQGVMADGRWYPAEDLHARMEEVARGYELPVLSP